MDELHVETSVQYEGVAIRVVHRVDRAASAELAEYLDLADTAQMLRAVLRFLERVLVSWEVGDEDGNPVPISEEGLESVPADFLLAVVRQLGDYQRQLGRLPDGEVSA